ncbi:hypothetical protein [Pectobacterium brasiliense]|uniref:hypothetical protein n=1 Tax=Pectobacterium brasiliense TaxID=180957 RepID=UPI001968E00C|nr:hypothetical protein [Pectobacterium brasiliense]MBN3261814.1 hypothetical protein [Pectobacterium brasiliense]
MPTSLNQYRESTGIYQNNFQKKREHIFNAKNSEKKESEEQNGIYHTMLLVNYTENTPMTFRTQRTAPPFPRNAISTALQLALLFSFIRPTATVLATNRDIELSETSNNFSYTAINDTLPEQQKTKRDANHKYRKKI